MRPCSFGSVSIRAEGASELVSYIDRGLIDRELKRAYHNRFKKEDVNYDPWQRDGSGEVFTLRCVRVSVDLCGRQAPDALPESGVPVKGMERQKATGSAH